MSGRTKALQAVRGRVAMDKWLSPLTSALPLERDLRVFKRLEMKPHVVTMGNGLPVLGCGICSSVGSFLDKTLLGLVEK